MNTATLQRFDGFVRKTPTCHVWQGTTSHGYGYIYAQGMSVRAHRLAFEHLGADGEPETVEAWRETVIGWKERAETAEAALERVRALAYSDAMGYDEEERIITALEGGE